MPLALTLTACVGVMLLLQGFFVLRTGNMAPFFLEPQHRNHRSHLPSVSAKIVIGFFYILAGATTLTILPLTAIRRHVTPTTATAWISSHVFDICFAGIPGFFGILFLLRPATLIRWFQRTYPEISGNQPSHLMIARIIGAGLLFVSVWSLKSYG